MYENAEDKTHYDYHTCSLLGQFHNRLTRTFHKLGCIIGNQPSYFIIIPIFLSLLAITGLQQMKMEKDPEYLFGPKGGQGLKEKTTISHLFPQNFSNFDPSRLIGITPFARLLVSAKDNGSMFRVDTWDGLNLVDEYVRNITVEWEEETFEYEDLCAKMANNECMRNLIFNLNEIMPEVANGSVNINYPIMLFPYMFPFFYGGPTIDEEEGIITATEAISLSYFLKAGTSKERERALIWETKLVEFFHNHEFENVTVAFYVSRALEDELDRNSQAVTPYFMINFVLIVIFSFLSVGTIDWVRSKFYMGFVGIISALLAMITGFGLLMYLQVPFIGINMAIPFLILGIGLDDQFVLLSGWHRTKPADSVPKRLAEAYSESAVSITITSLTNMFSFLVGSFSPFPAVSIFCLYTGVCVIFTYIWFITMFGGILAYAGRLEKRNTHSLSFKNVKPKSVAKEENKSKLYRLFCAGGINEEDEQNPKDNKQSIMINFFGNYLARYLSKPIVKGIVIVLFGAYMSGAIYGVTQLEEGLERRKLGLDDSFLIEYFNKEDKWFRRLPYRIQVVVNETLDYSDPMVKEQILELHEKYENSSYVGDKLYTQSWIRHFYRLLDKKPELKANVTDEASFIKVLTEKYLPKRKNANRDIEFNEDKTKITAIRFVIQTENIVDTNADKDMMQAMRDIANGAPFDVFVYHPFFIFFDQFLLTRITSIQAILFATIIMLIVSIIFIPHPICCLGVAFSIVSIEIGVIGYMALWKVNLDSISMINLIMCIGFSVDFSAHVSYAFVTAKVNTPEERIRAALQSLGLPVLQGGVSTILGVIVLYFAPSYVFQTFFKIIFLVIIFGITHGLLLLPVLLSLIGPATKSSSVSPPSIDDIVIEEINNDFNKPKIVIQNSSSLKDEENSDKDLGFGSSGSSQRDSFSETQSVTSLHSIEDHDSSPHGIDNTGYIDDTLVERL